MFLNEMVALFKIKVATQQALEQFKSTKLLIFVIMVCSFVTFGNVLCSRTSSLSLYRRYFTVIVLHQVFQVLSF